MNLEYIKQDNYLLPNLKIKEKNNKLIGKYGLLRLNYLKEHNKVLYTILLMEDKLTEHLISVDEDCNNKLNFLMERYKKIDNNLSESNKELNQIEWVKLMNNYRQLAEEIILEENIYI